MKNLRNTLYHPHLFFKSLPSTRSPNAQLSNKLTLSPNHWGNELKFRKNSLNLHPKTLNAFQLDYEDRKKTMLTMLKLVVDKMLGAIDFTAKFAKNFLKTNRFPEAERIVRRALEGKTDVEEPAMRSIVDSIDASFAKRLEGGTDWRYNVAVWMEKGSNKQKVTCPKTTCIFLEDIGGLDIIITSHQSAKADKACEYAKDFQSKNQTIQQKLNEMCREKEDKAAREGQKPGETEKIIALLSGSNIPFSRKLAFRDDFDDDFRF
jgi:hypothetical protein